MCGIAGILNFDGAPVAEETLRGMCRSMVHRGPDDEGVYLDGPLGFAHRRLSIIDLSSAGRQPMETEDGDFVIAYNGEIYNFAELRTELEGRGAKFVSRTDTEVLLKGYREWGDRVLDRLDGMFAFAVWDKKKRELFLARDRFGVKPLYVLSDGKRIVFGSEIKSILEAPGVKRAPDLRAMVEYFTFQNCFTDRTLFEGVRMVAPGTMLRIRDENIEKRTYWDFRFSNGEGTEKHWRGKLRESFENAVRRQLVSDVPVGSYLSGGMDSGSITAVAAGCIPRLMSFTGGFDVSAATGLEVTFDERKAAEAMASRFLTEHYEMVMHSGDMADALPKIVFHLEDLRVGQCWQNYYIARLASKFVKVVMGGTGGDEIFGGYPWRYQPLAQCADRDEADRAGYAFWQRLVPENEREGFFSDDTLDATRDVSTFDIFRDVMAPHDKASRPGDADGFLNRALYFESKTFLHGLLVVDDKLSMAHSLEARVPFLDNELVELAQTIPLRMKLRMERIGKGAGNGPLVSNDGKVILRKAMKGLVPDAVLRRKKQGFSPPDESWYRGPSIQYVKDMLLDPEVTKRGYFRKEAVERVVEEHVSGKCNHRLLIWSLICFELWHRIFMDEKSGIE